MNERTEIATPRSPVPAKIEEWVRYKKQALTLNDRIEAYHIKIFDSNASYRRFLDATWDPETIEGSLSADDLEAAAIIREHAKEQRDDIVGKLKKTTIVRALRVVLRRYHQDRKTRRYMVGGEVVPPDGNSDARHSEENGD